MSQSSRPGQSQRGWQADLGADVVEVELAAGRALDVYSSRQLDLLGRVGLAVLEVGELVGELADVVGDVELGRKLEMRLLETLGWAKYLVRVGLALLVQLGDGTRSNLKVLLPPGSVSAQRKGDEDRGDGVCAPGSA